MRICSFTLAKNESDIIEYFVRHTARYVDKMFIADNLSTDNTKQIMLDLQAEGLPLEIMDDPEPAHLQARKTNKFYRSIAKRDEFDVIFFVDADEFIEFDRADLKGKPGDIIALQRIHYVPPRDLTSTEPFFRTMPFRRAEPERSKTFIFLDPAIARRTRIGEGNHFGYLDGTRAEQRYLEGPVMRHFPIRSERQYVRKNLAGWMALQLRQPNVRLMRRTVGSHWRRACNTILENDGKIDYATLVHENYEGANPEEFNKTLVRDEFNIPEATKYTNAAAAYSPMAAMLQMFEKASDELWAYRKVLGVDPGSKVITRPLFPAEDEAKIPVYWNEDDKSFGTRAGLWLIQMISGRTPENIQGKRKAKNGMIATGATLEAIDRGGLSIWGTGANGKLKPDALERLGEFKPDEVCAIRGKLTFRQLNNLEWKVPRVFGDPLLLLPRFHGATPVSDARDIALCLDPAHAKLFGGVKHDRIGTVDLLGEPRRVVDEIAGSEVCVSTSLDALMIAQAYNVPWVWLRLENSAPAQTKFEFEDFFSLFESEEIEPATLAESDVSAQAILKVAKKARLPKSSFMADELLGAFPA